MTTQTQVVEEISAEVVSEVQTVTEEVTDVEPVEEVTETVPVSGETAAETKTVYETEEDTQAQEDMTQETTEVVETEADNADASGSCGQNVKWSYNSDSQTLTISGSGAMYNYSRSTMGSYSSDAPWISYNITTIIVEEGITNIGDCAFLGCGVLRVELGSSLKTIGENAFYLCDKLSKIKIPDGVTTIDGGAFAANSSLKSIELPNSITQINNEYYHIEYKTRGAFQDCSSLESVKIPPSIINIKEGTFKGCTNLVNIAFSSNLQIIEANAFSQCSHLESIKIPDKVERIGASAFSGCTGLTNVEFPDSLMDIGARAFSGCTGLKNIKIPENVSSIGGWAFGDCSTDLTLLVYNNSTAHKYAKENSLKYKVIATGISVDDIELGEGETIKLTAKLEPEGASYPDVTWTSSNPNIAAIEDGSVTGKQAGTCTVTAICGEYKATCKVTVTERKNVMDVYSDPPSGTKVAAGTQIELKCDTAGAKIYYTESGLDPSTNGQLYTQKITINTDTTIKAIAKKDGCIDSNVTELKFYVTGNLDPKPDQVSKVYANYTSGAKINAGTKIELYCDTPQAVIYYTLDNKAPTTNSTRYTGAITINADTVIKAIAVRDGYEDSEVAELKFYVTGNPDPEPNQVSKVYASYLSGQSVPLGTGISLYCDTPDATIYYTLDNTEPTTNSAHYTGEITISSSTEE